MLHALTIDVEEYFHVHAFAGVIDATQWDDFPSRVAAPTHRLLDLLAAHNVSATFFVLGWVARRQPALIRDIRAAGHEIASHGYWHQRVDKQSPEAFRSDIRLAKKVIESASGCRVTAYRAPSFSITAASPWAHEILVEEGYTTDSSQASGRRGLSIEPEQQHRPFMISTPSGPLMEFPLPAASVLGKRIPVGGGGYLRLFPYFMTRHYLQQIESAGQPFCVYLHPWELDPDQPWVAASWKQQIRHRIGLSTFDRKLVRLLTEFRFGTISDVLVPAVSPARIRKAA